MNDTDEITIGTLVWYGDDNGEWRVVKMRGKYIWIEQVEDDTQRKRVLMADLEPIDEDYDDLEIDWEWEQ